MAFDLDSAARSLREEPTPSPRILPTRRGARPLRWAAPMAAGIAVFVLWPRTGSSAWAQVAEKSRKETRVVVRSIRAGKLFSERMEDGARRSWVYYDSGGRIFYYTRTDGKHLLNYTGRHKIAWISPVAPVKPGQETIFGITGEQGLEELLKSEGVREIGDPKPEGKLVRYRLEWSLVARPGRTFQRRFDALADPKTGRLSRLEHLSGGKVTLTDEISYPDSIPHAKFALVAPPGVEIRRSEVALEGARRGLRKGIGTRKVSNQTVTLRGLLSDGGSLTILWTGSDLPSDGSIRATLVGASLRPAYGIPALSSKPEKDASFKPAIYAGLPVRGQSFFTPKGSERRYTVRIPVLKGGRKGGEAVFRDVAVTDISSIYAVGDPMMSPRKGKAAP